MPTYTVTIPDYHPPLLNVLLSRSKFGRSRLKKECAQLVAGYLLQAGVPKAKGKRRVSLTLSGWHRGGRMPDPDAFWKALLDALVQSGALIDDSSRWCDLGTVDVVRSQKKQTVITLEDVEEGNASNVS